MKLLLIGSGRAAQALGPRWTSAGYEVRVWSRRDGPLEVAPAADVVVFAVPDASIAEVARGMARRGSTREEVWLHLSGVHPAALLRPGSEVAGARAVGCLHPLVALAPGVDPTGAMAGIEGEPEAVPTAQRLARDAGLVPHAIPAERALYHAAAVSVAGHATALFSQALSLLEAAGFSRETGRAALQPLFASAAANLARGAPEAVITGPTSRGDVTTVTRHIDALTGHGDAAILTVYRTLAREALRLSLPALETEHGQALSVLLGDPVR